MFTVIVIDIRTVRAHWFLELSEQYFTAALNAQFWTTALANCVINDAGTNSITARGPLIPLFVLPACAASL